MKEKICATIFLKKFPKNKNYPKVRDCRLFTCKYKGAAESISNFRFNETNKICETFYNESNFDYYFIIKELADKSETEFECFEENTEKFKNFFFPIGKYATKREEDGNKGIYILQNETY